MSLKGLSARAKQVGAWVSGIIAWVSGIIAWADRLQRRHSVFGFPYAVVKKYGDDAGGRKPRSSPTTGS